MGILEFVCEKYNYMKPNCFSVLENRFLKLKYFVFIDRMGVLNFQNAFFVSFTVFPKENYNNVAILSCNKIAVTLEEV